MPIPFAASARSTVGIEWELALVDRDTRALRNAASQLLPDLQRLWPARDGAAHATSELLQNTVELVSAPHTTVDGAVADLRALARELSRAADALGLDVVGSGSHPFSRWDEQLVTESERYARFIDRTGWWGRNMLIWGVHAHIGLEDRAYAVPVMHRLLQLQPLFVALFASSPFWAGEATGYVSNRTLMFQQLPSAGLPAEVVDWLDYERVIDDLMRTGVINDITEARWDVRPAPRWGTIEMRFCDGTSSLQTVAALTALAQCVVDDTVSELQAGRGETALPHWYTRENKWRAARYGLDATVITDAAGEQQPLRTVAATLLQRLAPIAAQLGCTAELDECGTILNRASSAETQFAQFTQQGASLAALRNIVAAEASEFRASLARA